MDFAGYASWLTFPAGGSFIQDITLEQANFTVFNSTGTPTPQATISEVPIPEPSALLMVAMVALALLLVRNPVRLKPPPR